MNVVSSRFKNGPLCKGRIPERRSTFRVILPFQTWFQNLSSPFVRTPFVRTGRSLKSLVQPEVEGRERATAGSLRAFTFTQMPPTQYTSRVMPEASSDMDRSFANSNPEIQRVKRRLRKALPRFLKE